MIVKKGNRLAIGREVGIAWLLLIVLTGVTSAQMSNPESVIQSFGGECSGEKHSLSEPLMDVISGWRSGDASGYPCAGNQFCENAFGFDLNRDGNSEYFVRKLCGATGNCTYGIFADRPAKLLGTFTAWFFFVHREPTGWHSISTYTRQGGNQGYIEKYVVKKGQYRRASGRTERFGSDEEPYYLRMGMPNCK